MGEGSKGGSGGGVWEGGGGLSGRGLNAGMLFSEQHQSIVIVVAVMARWMEFASVFHSIQQ